MKYCPGCRLQLPDLQLADSPRFQAAGECWQLFQELSFYTLAIESPVFSHQFAVDAYSAQHAGGHTKPITVAFSLVGLYLAVEGNYTGRQVQQAHMRLAQQSKSWPLPPTHAFQATLTVQDVLLAEAGPARDKLVRAWSSAVWQSWQPAHGLVAELASHYLGVSF